MDSRVQNWLRPPKIIVSTDHLCHFRRCFFLASFVIPCILFLTWVPLQRAMWEQGRNTLLISYRTARARLA